jgi:hypothetical protein
MVDPDAIKVEQPTKKIRKGKSKTALYEMLK